MSNDLEQRLQEALDAGDVSDELLQELAAQPELEPMVDLDAALRSMPSVEFDLSEGVLARLDEDLDEIPGLFDAPHFDADVAPAEAPVVAPAAAAPAAAPAPISLDDERRKRSAAPFLLSAAAVIGLVATGTLMTLSSSPDSAMEMAASVAPSPTSVGAPEGYAAEERSMAPVAAEAAPEMPAELAELADVMEEPNEVMEPEAMAEAEADADDSMVAALQYDEAARNQQDMPSAAAPRSRMSARGGMPAPASPEERSEDQELSASQRRTLARIESCLPDHIRITRVRESTDGRRVVGVETSEPLSDSVDECVSGVLDTFPRARRRRARQTSSMSAPATTSTRIDE
ncbi:MAG: hypothetical protein AB8H86_20980 [Polyangiales bacterium]